MGVFERGLYVLSGNSTSETFRESRQDLQCHIYEKASSLRMCGIAVPGGVQQQAGDELGGNVVKHIFVVSIQAS